MVAVATLATFAWVVRQLSLLSVGMAANAETQELLRKSVEDQKRLARLDRAHTAEYRRRFDETQRLLQRMEILALSRRELRRKFELVLITFVAAIVAGGAVTYLLEQRRRERRLEQLGSAIVALSRGGTDIRAGGEGRDLIGRIARIVEETSEVVARERKRMQALEHLSSWQEAARRHAHELRTPLTAVQLEVDRLLRTLQRIAPAAGPELQAAEQSIREELEQLRTFTSNFTSFARIGEPKLRIHDVVALVEEFRTLFAPTWPTLRLVVVSAPPRCQAAVDREMIRQVLVNLCTNSALAAGAQPVTVMIDVRCEERLVRIEVRDDGPGIAPEILPRLFEPYATTRRIGEGMGLGLAISKKILLDHGGDLELLPSEHGAAFRITLPRASEAAS